MHVIRCVCGQVCRMPHYLCPFPNTTLPRVPSPEGPAPSCLPDLLCSPVLPSRSLEPAEDPVQTQLHRLLNASFYGYQDTPWQIFLRKEVPGAMGGAE